VSTEKRLDWTQLQRCLWRLHRDARPFLRRSLLIGVGACLFYRARLQQVADPDFPVPQLSDALEANWLSKDLDFTGIFSGDALVLLPGMVVADPTGRQHLEVEGIRLGFAQVGLTLDPELAMERARSCEFAWNSERVQFLVADPVSLHREKTALVERRNQTSDLLHLALLSDYVAWDLVCAVERLSQPDAELDLADAKELISVVTDVSRRAPTVARDPRVIRRLEPHLEAPTELAATLKRILRPS